LCFIGSCCQKVGAPTVLSVNQDKILCGRIYSHAEVGILLARKILRSEKGSVLENRVQQISKVLLIN
jgi:hypothetical protein